jgi:hypothetical protein
MTALAPSANHTIVEQIARLDSARLRGYREALAFYQGQQWPSQTRRRERRLVFNYAKAIIDKTASYLMSGVSFVVDEAGPSEADREQARRTERALRDVYEANDLLQLDFDNEVDCAVLGDGAYKVTWDPDERRVRISTPDVQGLYAWWVGDMSRVWRVASRYYLSDEESAMLYGSSVLRAPRRSVVSTTGRRQHTVVEVWTAEMFELWFDGALLETKGNPYGFVPFVIYPNLREPKKFWGTSDVQAVRESVVELNRALSQLSMILELSGNPERTDYFWSVLLTETLRAAVSGEVLSQWFRTECNVRALMNPAGGSVDSLSPFQWRLRVVHPPVTQCIVDGQVVDAEVCQRRPSNR